MVVKIPSLRVVKTTYVDDHDARIFEVFFSRFATNYGGAVFRNEDADGEQLVLVGPAWVGENVANHRRSISLVVLPFSL